MKVKTLSYEDARRLCESFYAKTYRGTDQDIRIIAWLNDLALTLSREPEKSE